jgi:hypothetical protein
VHLHRNDGLVGLQIRCPQQILPHGCNDWFQQLAYSHHPTVQRGPANLQSRVSLQHHGLPVQRKMVRVLGDHRLDHYPIAGQSLLHDARRHWRHRYRAGLAAAAGTLFTLDHPHEVPCRLDIHQFVLVVTDYGRLCAALPASLFRAANHFLDPRQILRQALPPRMRPALTRWRRSQRRTLRLRRYFIQRGARFLVGQQLQLQITQCLAARPQ